MNEKKQTGQSIMSMISCVIAVLLFNCIFMISEVHAQLERFAEEIETRMWLDIQHYWDDEDAPAISAKRELNDQASIKIVDGLNEMLSGQNLDPGQRYTWRSSGVGFFRLDYPRPDYPEVSVKEVTYWVPGSGLVVFIVNWEAHWRGLSHEAHNGPYIFFHLTGGYLWTRNNDVRIHIDEMDMTMNGTTWFAINDEDVVIPSNHGLKLGPYPGGIAAWNLGDIYSITYQNPNTWGWKERCGNRIIAEIQNNYSQRIKLLVNEALFKDFMRFRMGEDGDISRASRFWIRWRDWALTQESTYETYATP